MNSQVATARLSSIDSKQKLSEYDMVLVHAGINNVLNAVDVNTILQEYGEISKKIQLANKTAKLAFSSVLPKQHDRISKTIITERQYLFWKTINPISF